MENAGRNLEKQFAIFLKLMKICRDIGINPAQELPYDKMKTKHEGGEQDAIRFIRTAKRAQDNEKVAKGQAFARNSGDIPPRRTPKSKPKS